MRLILISVYVQVGTRSEVEGKEHETAGHVHTVSLCVGPLNITYYRYQLEPDMILTYHPSSALVALELAELRKYASHVGVESHEHLQSEIRCTNDISC